MTMKTVTFASACIAVGVLGTIGCGAPSDAAGADGDAVDTSEDLLIGSHLRGVADADFDTAKAAFVTVETVDDGLGPVFNDASCGNCHDLGATGGAGDPIERR